MESQIELWKLNLGAVRTIKSDKKIWHGTIYTPDPLILKGELLVLNAQSAIVILWLTSTKLS